MKTSFNFGLSLLLDALNPAPHHVRTPETKLPPLDLAQLRNLPRDPDRAGTSAGRLPRPGAFPAPVPFNYPNV